MRSRGRLAHLLVGLRFSDGELPPPRCPLAGERGEVGSVTSAARSPRFGPIGLGFVQASLAAAGTRLRAGEREAVVAELPFQPDTARPNSAAP
jgi:glycine cleavage system aminomethyltransferase T